MIKIGINDNVYIRDVAINEKGTLEITFDTPGSGEQKFASRFEKLASGEAIDTTELRINIFPALVPKENDPSKPALTQNAKVQRIEKDIQSTKGQLQHLMRGYMTKDQYLYTADIMYAGTGMDADNYETRLLNQGALDIISKNLFKFFLEKMQPYVGNPSLLFRLLLVRQSKDKPYATLRKNFLDEQPFWESMEIAESVSKLKFSDYELREGLNSAATVAKTEADNKSVPPTAQTPQSVFGG